MLDFFKRKHDQAQIYQLTQRIRTLENSLEFERNEAKKSESRWAVDFQHATDMINALQVLCKDYGDFGVRWTERWGPNGEDSVYFLKSIRDIEAAMLLEQAYIEALETLCGPEATAKAKSMVQKVFKLKELSLRRAEK